MDKILSTVQRKFIVTIIFVVVFVVSLTWAILQTYNQTELGSPAHISEVQKSSDDNQAFATYLEEQKAYEAHFITLASDIKQQEADRVTRALGLTTAVVVTFGIIAAIIAAKKLIRPVKEAYSSQERFIQDAAHELRNPLAAMTAALQQADAKTRATPLIKTMIRQTKRLIHINEDLLFLERRSVQPLKKINISELLHDVTEELQPLASSRSIKIQINTDKNIMKTISVADYVRMVKNIIDNAIKYSPNNKTVKIEQHIIKGSVVITVKDQGIGIPLNDQPEIGARFFRASNTGTIDGTGLGLAIVQKILNVYGGTKEIKSTPSVGTTVKLRIPA